MRQRRRRNKNNYYLNSLKIVSNILYVLIALCLIIFIISSINVKKQAINSAKEIKTDENKIAVEQEDNTSEQELNNITNSTLSESENTTSSVEQKQKDITITMAFTGDIMCHNTIYNDALDKETGVYDFSYIFEDIKYYIQTADIAIGNLETTFAGSQKGYSSYPTFNTPENLAYNLKKVGFDVLSTANNHCYDTGYSGIESTIDYLDDADIAHTGTYKSEQAQNTILIQNVKGISVAFLSFTYGTNGITVPSDKSYSVNLIDEELIKKQLSLAKEQKPDVICVSMHWGTEYETTPNSSQKDLADFLFENGADIIIGNHPHVLQSMEKREITLSDGTEKDGFVVYSLGNFLADQTKNYTRDSAILNLKVTKSSNGQISIDSATYKPIYTYKDSSKSTQKFKLIDLQNKIDAYEAGYTEGLTANLYNTFKTELDNVKKLLGEAIK